jgi:hypothetical protein
MMLGEIDYADLYYSENLTISKDNHISKYALKKTGSSAVLDPDSNGVRGSEFGLSV